MPSLVVFERHVGPDDIAVIDSVGPLWWMNENNGKVDSDIINELNVDIEYPKHLLERV